MALITTSNDKGMPIVSLCRWMLSFKLVARQLGPAGRTNLASPDHASREWTSKGRSEPIFQLNRRTSWNSPADGPVSLRLPVAHMAA